MQVKIKPMMVYSNDSTNLSRIKTKTDDIYKEVVPLLRSMLHTNQQLLEEISKLRSEVQELKEERKKTLKIK